MLLKVEEMFVTIWVSFPMDLRYGWILLYKDFLRYLGTFELGVWGGRRLYNVHLLHLATDSWRSQMDRIGPCMMIVRTYDDYILCQVSLALVDASIPMTS